MSPYVSDGTLTTDKRTVDDAQTWDSQSDWEAYQSATDVEIVSGAVQLAETTAPTTVVSRGDDNTSSGTSTQFGFEITMETDLGSIAARISSMTSGATTAYLRDSSDTELANQDISGLSAGDTFSFEHELQSGSSYFITLDADGAAYTAGINESPNYPYDGSEFDITARYDDGSTDTGNPIGINDIGNPDGVL